MTSDKMCPRCRVRPLGEFGRCRKCDSEQPQKEKTFKLFDITPQEGEKDADDGLEL